MISIEFAPSFQKHIDARGVQVVASTLSAAMAATFEQRPGLQSYVLDDQGSVRKHVTIFLNNGTIRDRTNLSDPLRAGDQVYVFQALSGG